VKGIFGTMTSDVILLMKFLSNRKVLDARELIHPPVLLYIGLPALPLRKICTHHVSQKELTVKGVK
jgi:hypothetical protein